jgi:hypothetical protein
MIKGSKAQHDVLYTRPGSNICGNICESAWKPNGKKIASVGLPVARYYLGNMALN